MWYKVIGPIYDIEIIAVGVSIRSLPRLRREYGKGRWRKLKGFAKLELEDGTITIGELHWYEAHGIGKKEQRLIRLLN